MNMSPERQHNFDIIWDRFPQYQNSHSSAWWYFLLLPKQAQGFGPKQMMFTFLTKVGKSLAINKVRHPGLPANSHPQNGAEKLPGMTVGWIYDGQTMHDELVHQPCTADLRQDGSLTAWEDVGNGRSYGCEMRSTPNNPFGVHVHVEGPKGCADFEVWGDPNDPITSPDDVMDYKTPFGGAHVIAWKHLRFQGEFVSPAGREQLEGIGYFQRVCLNINPFPWKWIWAAFEDETVFSAFIPYFGLNLFRRGTWFFPQLLEQATIPVKGGSYISVPMGNGRFSPEFDKTTITPIVGGKYPDFQVECRSRNGDFLSYRAVSHAHTQFLLDEPILGSHALHSRFNYNEYLFKIVDINGRIGDRLLNYKTLGQGWGNLEYTWCLGQ